MDPPAGSVEQETSIPLCDGVADIILAKYLQERLSSRLWFPSSKTDYPSRKLAECVTWKKPITSLVVTGVDEVTEDPAQPLFTIAVCQMAAGIARWTV